MVESNTLLDSWDNIFMPCRDYVVVLHNLNKSILFYLHYQVLEIGVRCA